MANFRTHVLGAVVAAAASAYAAKASGLVDTSGTLVCVACGALGGILPDIDADQSVPTRIIYGALGLAAATATAFALYGAWPTVLVALASLVALFSVSVVLRGLANRLCVHRGLIHSIPVAALSGALTATLAARLLGIDPTRAWLFGAFVTAGFIVHLLLDELFSVDLVNARLKRSFGTALKLGVRASPLRCALVCALVVALVQIGPPLDPFVDAVTAKRTRRAVNAAFGG